MENLRFLYDYGYLVFDLSYGDSGPTQVGLVSMDNYDWAC
jgi:hypothetical protein